MSTEIKGTLTFPGGVHPDQSKGYTERSRIVSGPVSSELAIMLSQHIGAPCEPLVAKNDEVRVGQMIGKSDAYVSAPVHSPVNGKVKDICLMPHAVLGRSKAVVIARDTQSQTSSSQGIKIDSGFSEDNYTAEQICDAVGNAGIVGMGGAGFPTRVKIEPNPRMRKETLIVNGCECEPFITCDNRIMVEWTDQILAGVRLARKASGCEQVIIAIEDNKPEAIEAVTNAAKQSGCEYITVTPLKTKYPQGGERQLIRSVLGKNVPTGGIPPMIGLVVLNVATAAAIAQAVIEDSPLTHRVVTITGTAIANPSNLYVPIGTPVTDLIEFCGGVTKKSAKVVLGGPMMGIAIADLSTPITKTSGAVTVLTKEQIGKAKFAGRETPCIRCGKCLEVCPENLNPTKIAHCVKNNMLDLAESFYINACMECGSCSYVCPANIELTGYIKTGKIHLARQKKKMPE